MIKQTRDLGLSVFQICDYPEIETLSDDELAAVRHAADTFGVQIELGTRGIQLAHLRTYLGLAGKLGATFVRSMINTANHRPSASEAIDVLRRVVPEFAARGATIGLETYEQVRTDTLLDVIGAIDDAHLGVVLDPANCVAALELPSDVIRKCAPYVVNLHVKDFAFVRAPGWVGFSLNGCPLGEGLLDYPAMLDQVRPDDRGINQTVEHWLPWQGNYELTSREEEQWTQHNVDIMRSTR